MHVLRGGHGAQSGLSRFTAAPQPITWTLPGRETLLLLRRRRQGDPLGQRRNRSTCRADVWREGLSRPLTVVKQAASSLGSFGVLDVWCGAALPGWCSRGDDPGARPE